MPRGESRDRENREVASQQLRLTQQTQKVYRTFESCGFRGIQQFAVSEAIQPCERAFSTV